MLPVARRGERSNPTTPPLSPCSPSLVFPSIAPNPPWILHMQGEASQPSSNPEASTPAASLETPEGYYALIGEEKVARYLAGLPK